MVFIALIVSGQPIFASDQEDSNIIYLTTQIQNTDDSKIKATNLVYRARQYYLKGDLDLALEDYVKALHYNHTGWIWKEMAQTCLKEGKYLETYEITIVLKEDFPNFLPIETERLELRAVDLMKREYLLENPPEIIYDQVAYKRRSRIDIINEIKTAEAAAAARYGPKVKYDT